LHAPAQAHYERLQASRARLLTTNYVTDETATRFRYDLGLEVALAFRDLLLKAEAKRRVRVIWIGRELEDEAWRLLARYADVQLSLTDATTAAVARARRVNEIFGFDQDFRALGMAVEPAIT
jgi:predicted nucleic acid-binding protein